MALRHFWAKIGPFAPNNFLEKIIIFILIYLLAHFIVQNWKKTLRIDPGYEDVPFSGPK